MAPHRAKGEEGRERGRDRPSSSASGKTGPSPTTHEGPSANDLVPGPSWGGNNNNRAQKARGMACTRCRQPDGKTPLPEL